RREIEPVDKKGDGHHQGDQPGQHTTDKTCGTHSFKTSPKVPSFGPTLTRKPDVGLTPCPGVRLTRLRVLYRPRKSCTRACVRWYPYENNSRTYRDSSTSWENTIQYITHGEKESARRDRRLCAPHIRSCPRTSRRSGPNNHCEQQSLLRGDRGGPPATLSAIAGPDQQNGPPRQFYRSRHSPIRTSRMAET